MEEEKNVEENNDVEEDKNMDKESSVFSADSSSNEKVSSLYDPNDVDPAESQSMERESSGTKR